jgi:hypothetical protein
VRTLLVLAVTIDTVTFLLLPPGSERNPLVLALGPLLAIALRWLAVVALFLVARRIDHRWQEALWLPGIVAAAMGAGANLSVLGVTP